MAESLPYDRHCFYLRVLYGFRIIPLPLDRSQGVNRAANALSASIQNVCVNHRRLDLDSVPVGIPQMESTSENLSS